MASHDDAHAAHETNYVKIWAILVALLVVSVTGPMLGIRVVTLVAAFGIAFVKAYMVIKNFMHLDIEKPVIHWVLGLAVLIMVVMYAGIAPDVQKSSGQRWVKNQGFHYLPAPKHEAAGEKGAGEHR